MNDLETIIKELKDMVDEAIVANRKLLEEVESE